MATSKFNLETDYMKIFSSGSENSNSAKRVEKVDITVLSNSFHVQASS